MEWVQIYDPLGSALLSTIAAALPIVLLLFTLGVLERPAHQAALVGLLAAVLIAIFVYGMPVLAASAAALQGAAYGLFPIGWIVLNAVFLYELTVSTGTFEIVKSSVAHLSADRRIQALLVAYSFGIFIEGAAGFGTPVAISSALMIGLGFSPLHAAGLSLIANTAPVAFGAIGTPIITLAAITGISHLRLSAMAGRQLAFVPILIPMWLVMTYSGTDATLGLAFTRTGFLYPFFAAMLGWLGVALTGSDTSSNVLFGSLQKITAQQLGLNPVLITAANSTGGVMGKMIDAQSIVVATASTGQHGQEGKILRFVFWHSIVLAAIMGVIVMLQAYVSPWMIP